MASLDETLGTIQLALIVLTVGAAVLMILYVSRKAKAAKAVYGRVSLSKGQRGGVIAVLLVLGLVWAGSFAVAAGQRQELEEAREGAQPLPEDVEDEEDLALYRLDFEVEFSWVAEGTGIDYESSVTVTAERLKFERLVGGKVAPEGEHIGLEEEGGTSDSGWTHRYNFRIKFPDNSVSDTVSGSWKIPTGGSTGKITISLLARDHGFGSYVVSGEYDSAIDVQACGSFHSGFKCATTTTSEYVKAWDVDAGGVLGGILNG